MVTGKKGINSASKYVWSKHNYQIHHRTKVPPQDFIEGMNQNTKPVLHAFVSLFLSHHSQHNVEKDDISSSEHKPHSGILSDDEHRGNESLQISEWHSKCVAYNIFERPQK